MIFRTVSGCSTPGHSKNLLDCINENPSAYNSEWTQSGYGWSREMYACPDTAVCVTTWVHGHPKSCWGPKGCALWS